MGLQRGAGRTGRGVWGIIAILIILAPAGAAGADDRIRTGIPVPDAVLANHTGINTTSLEEYHKTPEPVTVMHAEVSDSSLPGPRYMGFGPSSIGVSVSPVVLSALIVLVFLGAGL